MFLIYKPGLRGPTVSKVLALPTNGANKPITVLAKHALTPDLFSLPLKVLERIYPAPVQR